MAGIIIEQKSRSDSTRESFALGFFCSSVLLLLGKS